MAYQQQERAAPAAASRIESDIETLKGLTAQLEASTDRIMRHARTLGYFEPAKEGQSVATPVTTTLADALRELSRAVERNASALNVFD